MDTLKSSAPSCAPTTEPYYALYRVHPDGTEEVVPGSETDDQLAGIERGHRLSREEPGSAFTLRADGRSIYKFGHSTLKSGSRVAGAAALVIG